MSTTGDGLGEGTGEGLGSIDEVSGGGGGGGVEVVDVVVEVDVELVVEVVEVVEVVDSPQVTVTVTYSNAYLTSVTSAFLTSGFLWRARGVAVARRAPQVASKMEAFILRNDCFSQRENVLFS
jgi:hypothetical protein